MAKYELTITIFDEQHLNDVLQKLSEIDVELWKISRRTKGNSVFELKNALTNIENAIDDITNVSREARKLHEQAEN